MNVTLWLGGQLNKNIAGSTERVPMPIYEGQTGFEDISMFKCYGLARLPSVICLGSVVRVLDF